VLYAGFIGSLIRFEEPDQVDELTLCEEGEVVLVPAFARDESRFANLSVAVGFGTAD
jgi:hypothetical protein